MSYFKGDVHQSAKKLAAATDLRNTVRSKSSYRFRSGCRSELWAILCYSRFRLSYSGFQAILSPSVKFFVLLTEKKIRTSLFNILGLHFIASFYNTWARFSLPFHISTSHLALVAYFLAFTEPEGILHEAD